MSSDPESNLADLVQRVANVLSSAHECLELLVSPPEGLPRFVVAERLFPLGSLLVPGLLEVLTSGEADDELRGLAALLGFAAGENEEFAMELLRQVESDGPFAALAARRLAQAEFTGIAGTIEAAIRRLAPSSPDEIVAYLDSLCLVGYLDSLCLVSDVLPTDLRQLLLDSGDWRIEEAVMGLFPA